jgi:DNA ligase-1
MPSVNFRPMLACSESCHNFFAQLKFPLLASAKIDGIRATVRNGVVYARSNQPFPNINIQKKFGHLEYFDGEFVLGSPTRHDLCRATGGVTNSKEKPVDDLRLFAFDHVKDLGADFGNRQRWLMEDWSSHGGQHVVVHEQALMPDMDALLRYEQECLDDGYEGLILRDPSAPYKCGRSTAREQYLLKLKRFVDGEFKIVGTYEEQANNNEAKTSALGRTKRSSAKAGKTGKGTLGGLILEWSPGVTFRCGVGFSDGEADRLWAIRDELPGQLAKIKYFDKGMKDLPRHPCYLLIRDRIDL